MLTDLLKQVQDGTLTLDQACRRGDELGAVGAISPGTLTSASDAAFRQSVRAPDAAWALVRVAQAAARASWQAAAGGLDGPDLTARPWATTIMGVNTDLIAVASAALRDAGDIRVFLAAREASEEALAVAVASGLSRDQGVILQRRGAMTLDCYCKGTPQTFSAEWDQWVARALDRGDPELLFAVSTPVIGSASGRSPLQWPEPPAALAAAEEDLRAALQLVAPERRGPVLKALAQTLHRRAELDGRDPGPEFVRVARAALEELADDALEPRMYLVSLLDKVGSTTSSGNNASEGQGERSGLVERVERDWDRLAERPDAAWDAAQQAVAVLQDIDPARAQSILARQRTLSAEWASEQRRAEHYRTELLLVTKSQARSDWKRAWDSAEDLESVATEVSACARTPDAVVTVGGLTLLMLASTRVDREGLGFKAYTALCEQYPTHYDRHAEAYTAAMASLALGEGVNRERAGDDTAAVGWFLTAADGELFMGGGQGLTRALTYLGDLVGAGRVTDLAEVSAWCATNSLEVELLSPAATGTALQRLLRLVVAHQVRHGTSVEELVLLLQAARGRRFAAALALGSTGWSPPPRAAELLERERELMSVLPDDTPLLSPPDDESELDEEDVLVAYSSEYETSPADDAHGRLVNLRRGVERAVVASLVPANREAGRPALLEEIRAALDPRSALVVLYDGQWTSGDLATFGVLVTRNSDYVEVGTEPFPFPAAPIGLGSGGPRGRTIHVPPRGLPVANLRRAVQEEPAPRTVAPDAAQALDHIGRDELRVVTQNLDALRDQKITHLLVSPHGAGHFSPYHLAGEADRPLADHLTITYLSNLGQLVSRPSVDMPRRSGAAVFGLGYHDQPRLPVLESSEAEARAVADLLGTTPILDGRATGSRLVEALESYRWVHLRAHGRHDVDAPMFQTVFLSPGEGGDGRLRAYEVLGLDLRGLELVTLGACQTALGRFDALDNLRGLPAALLLAGAQAVVGTLWEVLADASTVFFTALYGCLARDDADVVTAFGVAQRATRARFPEYRDWGAFYLDGGCGVQRTT